MELLNEDVFREMLKYLSLEKISEIRSVNKQFDNFCGGYLLSEIVVAEKLLNKERIILKTMLNRNPQKRTPFERFLSRLMTLLTLTLEPFIEEYEKYFGKGLFPPVPAKVQ
jgi:hypothetical protein